MATTRQENIGKHLKDALNRSVSQLAAQGENAFIGRKRDTSAFVLRADRIRRDADQVRTMHKNAQDPDVQALAASIKSDGLRAYPEVRWIAADDIYELVTGERRFTAMTEILKWEEIPVRVIDVPEANILWLQLHENIHRKALAPVELAQAVQKAAVAGLSLTVIAEKLHKSKSYVQKALTIAQKLSPAALKIVEKSPQAASLDAMYAIATVPESQQAAIAKSIVDGDLTQREILQITGEQKAEKSPEQRAKGGRPTSAKPFRTIYKIDDLTISVQSRRSRVKTEEIVKALQAAAKMAAKAA